MKGREVAAARRYILAPKRCAILKRFSAPCVYGLLSCLIALPVSAVDLVLSEFNDSGFDYTFLDMNQILGTSSVRLVDTDDSGGAGSQFSSTIDLSAHADSRLVVDMFTNPGNQTGLFDLELIDTADRRGKWSFGVSNLVAGVPNTLIASTTLANPTHGIGDFSNLDLNNITTWQILGSFGSSSAFDMNFDRVLISDTVAAPPAYPGAEPDAPWRAQSASRIDANRKADLRINVTDSLGNAISGAEVSVNMKQHEFGFGSAVVGYRLSDNHPQHATYKQKVAELFNIATFENTLKWEALDGQFGSNFSQQIAQAATTWLAGQEIDVRGHNLIWPSADNLPPSVANLVDSAPLNAAQQQQLRNAIATHIADIAGDFAGQLTMWDVINEERANHDVMDVLAEGDLAMVDWFNQAKSADPVAKLYLNEYGILDSAGGTNTANQQTYYDTLEFLKNSGAPIEGIGFQGHFQTGTLTGPEQLWTILDRFDQLGLDMQITEFDYETIDRQLQADYTRDFLTAMFAHEGVDDVLMWGFWEDAHWRPDAALFDSNWSIRPNGQAYLDLVFGQWWTEEDLVSASAGTASLSGFKGEYEISAMHNGATKVVAATLTDGGLILDISLPTLSADFDGDGDVDDSDLSIWSAGYGLASGVSQSAGDADGDGDIDSHDFLLWQQQFGTSPMAALAAVPEPASASLLLGLVSVCLGLNRPGRRV